MKNLFDMATIVTMIGTHEDLEWIYENCTTDSSSEPAEEQAFGYDYLTENVVPCRTDPEEVDAWRQSEHPDHEDKSSDEFEFVWWRGSSWSDRPLFTKKDFAWECLMKGYFSEDDVLDLRPREGWYSVSWNKKKHRNRTKEEIIEWFKELPDNVTFFFGYGHS